MNELLDLLDSMWQAFVNIAPALFSAAVTLAICYLILRGLRKFLRHALELSRLPETLRRMALTVIQFVYWYFVVIAVLSQIPALSSLALAFGSIFAFLSLAIGMAMSGLLKDLVSGAYLVVDKDFGVGFRVKAANIEGVIEALDIRKTRIRDKDGNLVVIPNSAVDATIWYVYERPKEQAE